MFFLHTDKSAPKIFENVITVTDISFNVFENFEIFMLMLKIVKKALLS